MIAWLTRHKYRMENGISFALSGRDFFDRLEALISSAVHTIHIQVYIFNPDDTGRRIMQLLKEAAGRGVNVFVVVDAYGSEKLDQGSISDLEASGIHVRKFSPVKFKGFRIGRRLHHKIFLADGTHGMIGGINIADKYRGDSKTKEWLDFGVEIRGTICQDLKKICETVWRRSFRKKYFRHTPKEIPADHDRSKFVRARVLQNDWFRRIMEVSGSYRQSVRYAKGELFIVASYFVPGIRIRKLIKKATARGVRVRMLLSGISDVAIVRRGTSFLYDWMLRNNVEIYEWRESVLHGKLMVVDREKVNVGSYNLNSLSDYGSLELNIEVDDTAFAEQILALAEEKILSKAHRITKEEYRTTWYNQFLNWCSYHLSRLSLLFLFFIIRRDEHKRSSPRS